MINEIKIINRLKNNSFRKINRLKNSFRKIKRLKNSFRKNMESVDKRGQLSLEFILISFVAILIFVSISLPLTSIAIDSILDSTNAIETKSEILKIINSIDDVYSDGVGSKRIVFIEVPQDTTVHFYKNISSNTGIASGSMNLNNDVIKVIEIPFKANNIHNTVILRKKVITKVTVEWREENIVVKN